MLTSGYGRYADFPSRPPGLGLGAGASMDFSGDGAPIITTDVSQGYLPTPPPETIMTIPYAATPSAMSAGLTLPPAPAPTTKQVVNNFTDWININKTYVYALLAVLGVVSFLKRK